METTSLLQTRSQTTPPSCSFFYPLYQMSFFDIDAECRDENEGSIITSLISQLRLASALSVCFTASHRMFNSPWISAGSEWIFQRSHFRHSFLNLEACWNESPISCRTRTSFLGTFSLGRFQFRTTTNQDIHSADTVDDSEERFIRVLQYYLAGWHIKPKGVKKPWVRYHCPSSHSLSIPQL